MSSSFVCIFSSISFLIVALTGCSERVVHGVSEGDANKIVADLHDFGISASKISEDEADGGWSISVSSRDAISAMRFLDSSRAMPVAKKSNSSSSFIPSREDQLFRFERQVSSGLEETIKTIGGVLDARVHLNLPRRDSVFGGSANGVVNTSSASVLLVVNPEFVTNPSEVTALVSGAAGIPAQLVSVVVNRAVPKI